MLIGLFANALRCLDKNTIKKLFGQVYSDRTRVQVEDVGQKYKIHTFFLIPEVHKGNKDDQKQGTEIGFKYMREPYLCLIG